jgi:Zn-dependent protease
VRSSLRLGRVIGIPIEVHWSILAIVALFTVNLAVQALPLYVPDADLRSRLVAATVGIGLFFASILAHELGHALVALNQGVGVSGITLWLLGGMAQLDRIVPTARAELRIAAAGPAVSGLLGLFFLCSTVIANEVGALRLIVAVGAWLATVNLALTLFNLLPAAPLDGGRILSAVLWKRMDDAEKARVVSGRCGLILGAALALYGVFQVLIHGVIGGWMPAVVGLFVLGAARTEIRLAVVRQRLQSTTAAQVLIPHPPAVPDSVSVRQLGQWAGAGGLQTAYPVVRWDPAPIGYVVPGALATLPPAQQSWTKLSQVMRSVDQVDRIGLNESAGDILARWGTDRGRIAVVYDRDPGLAVGTVTFTQLQSLLVWPDLWGRDRKPDLSRHVNSSPIRQP